ncbi:hypothetical protein AMTRI_Chr11g154100 [Amborella trichopoda]
MFIGSQRKLGYITGKVRASPTNDLSHDEWENENLTIMAWFFHSKAIKYQQGAAVS